MDSWRRSHQRMAQPQWQLQQPCLKAVESGPNLQPARAMRQNIPTVLACGTHNGSQRPLTPVMVCMLCTFCFDMLVSCTVQSHH